MLKTSGKVSLLAILFIETNRVPWFLYAAAIRMTDKVLLTNCSMLALGSRFCSVQDLRATLEWIYFLSLALQKLEGL